jgi:hypothetical protein
MAIKKVDGQRGVRTIMGRVDVSGGTPSVGAGVGFTVADTAAGQVTVTLDKPGKSILGVNAIAVNSTDATEHHVKVKSYSAGSSVVFNVYAGDATDGVLADNVGFFFEIHVKDVSN